MKPICTNPLLEEIRASYRGSLHYRSRNREPGEDDEPINAAPQGPIEGNAAATLSLGLTPAVAAPDEPINAGIGCGGRESPRTSDSHESPAAGHSQSTAPINAAGQATQGAPVGVRKDSASEPAPAAPPLDIPWDPLEIEMMERATP